MRTLNVVSREEWTIAHEALLTREKEMTRALDELAAERRRQPVEHVEKEYSFDTTNGKASLAGLFEGRSQLIVYHHMLKPGDEAPCPGCSMFVDTIGDITHLKQRDTSMVLVSRAPVDEIEAFKKRMGWTLPWVSTTDSFNKDFGVADKSFGLNVFLRDGDAIYRSYFTDMRGIETLGTTWTFLDLTPLGRQEEWEDSPEGTPQSPPFQWWRLHDEYATDERN